MIAIGPDGLTWTGDVSVPGLRGTWPCAATVTDNEVLVTSAGGFRLTSEEEAAAIRALVRDLAAKVREQAAEIERLNEPPDSKRDDE